MKLDVLDMIDVGDRVPIVVYVTELGRVPGYMKSKGCLGSCTVS